MTKVIPPSTHEEYFVWLKNYLNVEITSETRMIYEWNIRLAYQEAQDHEFFSGLKEFLQEEDNIYLSQRDTNLLMNTGEIRLYKKSYESVVNKSFRQNVILNNRFSGPPKDGWILPDNWFTRMNDLIRGTIVCKYIDGPKLLSTLLTERANRFSLQSRVTNQQRDDGYYAFHFYVKIPVNLMDSNKRPIVIDLEIEMQLTTQLQEVLYKITHRFYEHTRNQKPGDQSWKWDTGSSRFRAGYISHTLHLLEAIIMELRDEAHSSGNIAPIGEDNE
jgi:ppGpp synthetase/RelA/SpoT-type nucleotidyltranferase